MQSLLFYCVYRGPTRRIRRSGSVHTARRLRSKRGAGAQYPTEPTRGTREPTPPSRQVFSLEKTQDSLGLFPAYSYL